MMKLLKPRQLPIVRPLPGHLKMQPLLREVEVVGSGLEAYATGGVVAVNEVLDYCAGFPDREVCVWVVEGWESAVWV